MKCSLLKYIAAAAGTSSSPGGDNMQQDERCAAATSEFNAGLEPVSVHLDSAAGTEPIVRKAGHEKGLANEEQRERERRSGSRCLAERHEPGCYRCQPGCVPAHGPQCKAFA